MTLTLSKCSATRRATRRNSSPNADQAHARRRAGVRDGHALERYTDSQGHAREVLARPGAAGSVLVVDRDSAERGDIRLVAHLAPDAGP